jgi:hypothetical protein
VLFQCQQAFDSPYTNTIGQEERVEHVYVISPHHSSSEAIESIKGALQSRSGQVTFLCGSDLLDIFKHSWPTFLAFEGDFLGRYLNDLRRRVDRNAVSSGLSLRHSIIAPASQMLSTVYVPQRVGVTLNDFDARALSWYPDLLESVVSLAELQDAQFNISVLISVLSNARLWMDSPEALTWQDAGLALKRVLKALPTLWDQAFRAVARLTKGDQLPSQSLTLVRLTPDDTLKEEYGLALMNARECWAAFTRVLANERASIKQYREDAVLVASHAAFPRHCAICEAVSRSALAITKTSSRFSGQITSKGFSDLLLSVVITAPAGFGKTSLCHYHALRDTDGLLNGTSDILPIYVPLHEIAYGKGEAFSELFLRTQNLREVIESGECQALPFRRIRLYLDGLDEVPDRDRRRLIVLEALSAPLAWPIQVIITARDHAYDDFLATMPRLTLSPFDGEEMNRFIMLWLEGDRSGVTHLKAHLKNNAAVRELATVPLIGTILVGVYRRLRQIPETKVALYETCVDLLCGGWDFVKQIQRKGRFDPNTKLTILKTLAGQLHARGLRQAEPSDVQRALSFSLNRLESKFESVLEEIVEDGLLVRSGRLLMFSHLSFQEFLAAKDLSDPSGRKQSSALRRYMLGDDWWKEVLLFYIGQLNDPYAAQEWVGSIIRGIARVRGNSVDAELKIRTATLERAIRASYPDFQAPPILK